MGGHRLFVPAVLLAAGLLLPTAAAAQRRAHHERGAPQDSGVVNDAIVGQPVPMQPVVVRPVQVREVRVAPPVVTPPRMIERPSFGVARPVVPQFISRPGIPSARPVTRVVQGRRPFYLFWPHFNVGFGVMVGYPVAYPYVDPYATTTAYPSYRPAAPPRTMYSNVESVTPGLSTSSSVECDSPGSCGGLSFDITPSNAQVSVDGVFVGTVEEFNASSAPLILAPGNHYIEVRLAGYRTSSFDVTIAPGEVTPYQGTLEPLRTR